MHVCMSVDQSYWLQEGIRKSGLYCEHRGSMTLAQHSGDRNDPIQKKMPARRQQKTTLYCLYCRIVL